MSSPLFKSVLLLNRLLVMRAGSSPAPVLGGFDDYLINCWATSSMTWTESRAQQYVETIEPQILENSAACLVVEGAAAKAYDPAV